MTAFINSADLANRTAQNVLLHHLTPRTASLHARPHVDMAVFDQRHLPLPCLARLNQAALDFVEPRSRRCPGALEGWRAGLEEAGTSHQGIFTVQLGRHRGRDQVVVLGHRLRVCMRCINGPNKMP